MAKFREAMQTPSCVEGKSIPVGSEGRFAKASKVGGMMQKIRVGSFLAVKRVQTVVPRLEMTLLLSHI